MCSVRPLGIPLCQAHVFDQTPAEPIKVVPSDSPDASDSHQESAMSSITAVYQDMEELLSTLQEKLYNISDDELLKVVPDTLDLDMDANVFSVVNVDMPYTESCDHFERYMTEWSQPHRDIGNLMFFGLDSFD